MDEGENDGAVVIPIRGRSPPVRLPTRPTSSNGDNSGDGNEAGDPLKFHRPFCGHGGLPEPRSMLNHKTVEEIEISGI